VGSALDQIRCMMFPSCPSYWRAGWTPMVELSGKEHTGLVQWAVPYLPTYGHAVEVPIPKLARQTFRRF
jgi:hypothetical protein